MKLPRLKLAAAEDACEAAAYLASQSPAAASAFTQALRRVLEAPTRPVAPIDPGQFFPVDVGATLVLLGPNVELAPEPAAAMLALAGIACVRRRRR